MLFYWMIWIKLGWDDAREFSVREFDLWVLLGISILFSQNYSVNLLFYSIIAFFLIIFVLTGLIGSADRDVLLIMFLTLSLHDWLRSILFATCLALIYSITKQRKVVPFIFFLSLGHLLSFCVEML